MTPDTADPEVFEAEASPQHGILLYWRDGGREQLDWSTGVIVRRRFAASPELWLPEHLFPALPMTARDLDDIDLLRDLPDVSPAHLMIFWLLQGGPR
jgi:hypothetical protein